MKVKEQAVLGRGVKYLTGQVAKVENDSSVGAAEKGKRTRRRKKKRKPEGNQSWEQRSREVNSLGQTETKCTETGRN